MRYGAALCWHAEGGVEVSETPGEKYAIATCHMPSVLCVMTWGYVGMQRESRSTKFKEESMLVPRATCHEPHAANSE